MGFGSMNGSCHKNLHSRQRWAFLSSSATTEQGCSTAASSTSYSVGLPSQYLASTASSASAEYCLMSASVDLNDSS